MSDRLRLPKISITHLISVAAIVVVVYFMYIFGQMLLDFSKPEYISQFQAISARTSASRTVEYRIIAIVVHGCDYNMHTELTKEEFEKLWPVYEKKNKELAERYSKDK